MPFGATPSRWCVCHFTTSAECANSNYTIASACFAGVRTTGEWVNLKKSLKQSESEPLAFNCMDDVFDLVGETDESGNGGFIFGDSCEDYEKFEIDVALRLRSRFSGEEFHLIFCAVPGMNIWNPHFAASTPQVSANNTGNSSTGDEERVFIAVTCLVECNEYIVPSLVRLERAKQRPHFRWDIFTPSFKFIFKLGEVSSEWEVGVLNSGTARRDSNGVNGMIERRPEVIDDIPGDQGKLFGDGASQAHLLHDVLRLVRVRIGKKFPGIIFNEAPDFPYEFIDVFATPSEFEVGAIEWTGHDPDCTNPKPLFARLHMIPKVQPNPSLPTAYSKRQQPSRESNGASDESE